MTLPGTAEVVLASGELSVTLLPAKGGDIFRLVDVASGTDVLFKSPWGLRPPPWAGSTSMERFIEAYPGGWQLLLPNGGDECTYAGARLPYHGEAAVVPWELLDRRPGAATLGVALRTAPLSVERELAVEGPVLRITERVTNRSPDPYECMWSHHPAFGAPFLDGGCRLSVGCETVVADDRSPGTLLEAASRHEWPLATSVAGLPVDLRVVPPPGLPRSLLAYAEDFVEPYFAISNPDLGLGVGVRWPREVFPTAWLWQEVHEGAGWPWFRQAYVVAVEPASTSPGQGLVAALGRGGHGVRFAPHETVEVVVEAVLFHGGRDVAGIDEGGRVRFR
ncbi:MAG: hypothetical protein M0Z33_00220 [Actinomycetota bacterium]|nr:hypothetical protein [Actinomycetota bacterium]